MNLECKKCGQVFTKSTGYYYHVDNDVCDGKSHFCKYCGKGFTQKNSMYRHIKNSCAIKKEQDQTMEDLQTNVAELIKENKAMRRENEALVKRVTKIEKSNDGKATKSINNGTINNNITNNNVTNNNIIVAFGKEDMSRIDREDIIKALKTGFKSTKNLTEVMHFNPKYPEFSNIKRTNFNMKHKYEYHDGKRWVMTVDPTMIDDIYEKKRDYIEESMDDYQENLTKADVVRLQRWLAINNDDDKRIRNIKNEIRELLYNKKDMIEHANSNMLTSEKSNIGTKIEKLADDSDLNDSYILIQAKVIKEAKDAPIKRIRRVARRTGKHRKAIKA